MNSVLVKPTEKNLNPKRRSKLAAYSAVVFTEQVIL